MESRSRPDANERPGGNRDAREAAPLTSSTDHNDSGGALTVPLASFCAAACVGVPGRCPWQCPSIGGAR